ncbi:MAG: very short patch repair endonuclease [Blastocatellia bacterium]
MADVFTPEQRSLVMASVHEKNTTPELAVRSLLHRMGCRFRLHRKDIPGKPDIVLPRHKKSIFVHGCFWHQHKGCKHAARPTSNTDYWNKKLDRNIERDKANRKKIGELGWKVMVIWECETRNHELLADKLLKFIGL